MNIFDRIINMLLEARVEMFIQDRLDEIAKITPKPRPPKMMMPKKQPKSKTSEALKRWEISKK